MAIWSKLGAWFVLSRPPFHTVGVLPFILGGVLAWRLEGYLRWDIVGWGTLGVVLIMLATYYAGEYWDQAEDDLSGRLGRSRFAGGSGVMQAGLLSHRAPLWGSVISALLACGVALVLRLFYHTGPWTVPFAALGLLGGFFYSTRPVRWVGSGLGELWIAFCYGWLPVAVGCYLQTGAIAAAVHWMAVPVGLTILNVILLNEYPDYPADRAAGKKNWVVRLGPERAAWLYGAFHVLAWVGMIGSALYAVPARVLWFYLPVFLLSLFLAVQVVRGRWLDRAALERLCALNLLVNLGTTAVYILVLMR